MDTDEDADIFIVSDVVGDLNITKNLPLDIRLQTNNTQVATNTFISGILPMFAWNKQANTKPYSLSGLGIHLNTSFDNAQSVMRDDTKGYFVNKFGEPRSKDF